MILEGKQILIISPQKWGIMKISKHNYAIELAEKGNIVYFLNPPDKLLKVSVKLEKTEYKNLFLISYKPLFPFQIRFRFRGIFEFLMKYQIKKILKYIKGKLDVVWCFESNLISNLKHFGGDYNIYHPVDLVIYPYQIKPGASADIIFSVSETILNKFSHIKVPQFIINHGLKREFVDLGKEMLKKVDYYRPHSPIKVGYVGNLTIPFLNRALLLKIFQLFPKIEFHLWGAYIFKDSNIAGDDSAEQDEFAKQINVLKNVYLKGAVKPEQLVNEIAEMDLFLICYKTSNFYDLSNSHKILEYLSTGKVIVSNPILSYLGQDEILNMGDDDSDSSFLKVFHNAIEKLEFYNSSEYQRKRINYSLHNSYQQQIVRIERLIK